MHVSAPYRSVNFTMFSTQRTDHVEGTSLPCPNVTNQNSAKALAHLLSTPDPHLNGAFWFVFLLVCQSEASHACPTSCCCTASARHSSRLLPLQVGRQLQHPDERDCHRSRRARSADSPSTRALTGSASAASIAESPAAAAAATALELRGHEGGNQLQQHGAERGGCSKGDGRLQQEPLGSAGGRAHID